MSRNTRFVLQNDARESRPWQVWVNNSRLAQANTSNPRIRGIDINKQNHLGMAMDRVLGVVYEVRIVKLGVDPALIDLLNKWELSFDGGATRHQAIALSPIRETPEQDLAWLVYLELQRDV